MRGVANTSRASTPFINSFTISRGGPSHSISSLEAFDNMGLSYNLSRILNDDGALDIEAYKNYSPLFLSTTFAMAYGLSFLAITGNVWRFLSPFSCLLPWYHFLTSVSLPTATITHGEHLLALVYLGSRS